MRVVSPVFSRNHLSTDATEVNGREFTTFKQAVNVYRKEKDMQAFLSLCLSRTQAYHDVGRVPAIDEPIIDSPQWQVESLVHIGDEYLVRFRSLEQLKWSLLGFEVTEEEGFVTGWVLATPQNLKAIRDRMLYIDFNSFLFGEANGRNVIIGSECIGTFRDSAIHDSKVAFCLLTGARVHNSAVDYSTLTDTKILHSNINRTTAVKSLVSSSTFCSFTLIRSQVTDTSGEFSGLQDCNICSKRMSYSKITNMLAVGGDPIENEVEASIYKELKRAMLTGDRSSAIQNVKRELVKAEPAIAGKWEVEKKETTVVAKTSGGRTEIDLSGGSISQTEAAVFTNESPSASDTYRAAPAENTEDADMDDDIEDDEYLAAPAAPDSESNDKEEPCT